MNQVKLVAIVPVYNTEPYLRKCLDSLVQQSMPEVLILVVNDGSSDNSPIIIEEYTRNYPDRVMGYTTPNKGIGMARNFGIERANEILGADRLDEVFVSFVDSDDWLDLPAFELSYNEAVKTNADIVCTDFRYLDGDQVQISKGFWGTDINDPYQRIMNSLDYSAWAKIYRLSLFNDLRFPEIMYEDVVAVPLLFRKAKKAAYLPEPLYNYSVRGDSTSHTVDPKRDSFKAIKLLLDYGMTYRDDIILQYLQRSLDYFIQEKL